MGILCNWHYWITGKIVSFQFCYWLVTSLEQAVLGGYVSIYVLSQCWSFVVLSCLLCQFLSITQTSSSFTYTFHGITFRFIISRGVKCVSVMSCIDLTMAVQCISYGISQSVILWYVIPSLLHIPLLPKIHFLTFQFSPNPDSTTSDAFLILLHYICMI